MQKQILLLASAKRPANTQCQTYIRPDATHFEANLGPAGRKLAHHGVGRHLKRVSAARFTPARDHARPADRTRRKHRIMTGPALTSKRSMHDSRVNWILQHYERVIDRAVRLRPLPPAGHPPADGRSRRLPRTPGPPETSFPCSGTRTNKLPCPLSIKCQQSAHQVRACLPAQMGPARRGRAPRMHTRT